jgi:hypothetical protein
MRSRSASDGLVVVAGALAARVRTGTRATAHDLRSGRPAALKLRVRAADLGAFVAVWGERIASGSGWHEVCFRECEEEVWP